MKHPQILLSHLSMWGMPVSRIIKIAAEAGFDGVEIFLSNPVKQRIAHYRELTGRHNLVLHFHQFISPDEDPGHLIFRVLGAIGYLPKTGYSLNEHIPLEINEPVVVNGDRCDEAWKQQNWWLQTVSATGKNDKYKLRVETFLQMAALANHGVVFDTQHLLEYLRGVRGIEKLSQNIDQLMTALEYEWNVLHYNVKEIHLNNFDPSLGHTGGRNTFPDKGVLPLKEFIATVKQSGWAGGFITPEVSPMHMFPYGVDSAKRLLEITKEIIN